MPSVNTSINLKKAQKHRLLKRDLPDIFNRQGESSACFFKMILELIILTLFFAHKTIIEELKLRRLFSLLSESRNTMSKAAR